MPLERERDLILLDLPKSSIEQARSTCATARAHVAGGLQHFRGLVCPRLYQMVGDRKGAGNLKYIAVSL